MIDKAVEKLSFKVKEGWTKTRTVIAVIISIKMAVQNNKKPAPFRADHPFIFLIQHNKTGAILFIGNVYEPK